MEPLIQPPYDRRAQHPIVHFTLSSLAQRASELNTNGVAPADLWLQVEQLLLSMYRGRSLDTAITDLSCLAARRSTAVVDGQTH